MLRSVELFTIVLALLALQLSTSVAQQRIIGGKNTDALKYPALVSIRHKISSDSAYLHHCGGVIYNERVVITAAQCVLQLNANEPAMILAGASTRTGGDGKLYVARHWVVHESYDSWLVDYDIGLIWIEDKFDFSTGAIKPVQISEQRPRDGRTGLVPGWGYIAENGPSAYWLQETTVPVVSRKDCIAAYSEPEITERVICAGNLLNGGKDACQGDLGGPLIFDGQLVGLVSWGRGCGRPGYPSVYTFVPAFKTWIEQQISENSY